jgi:GT2 family glycosyltransferase
MEKYPKVAIVYLAYHPDDYIDRFVEAVKNIVYPKEQIEILIVENKHPDFELSLELIENKILDLSEKNFPHITYLPQKDNLGFSKGVNKGISWALEHNFEYMYLHNQDGFMHPECLKQLVEVLEGDLTIGAAQSLLLCYPLSGNETENRIGKTLDTHKCMPAYPFMISLNISPASE